MPEACFKRRMAAQFIVLMARPHTGDKLSPRPLFFAVDFDANVDQPTMIIDGGLV